MDSQKAHEELKQEVAELRDRIAKLTDTQNAQYTDIMLALRGIEQKLQNSDVSLTPAEELYDDARELVIEHQTASTSFLQRCLRIGYSRAAQIIDRLEEEGVITKSDGGLHRKVLVLREEDLN